MKKLFAVILSGLIVSCALAQTNIQPFKVSKVIDLTHVMHNDMAYWPGGVPFTKKTLVTHEKGGYLLHQFTMGENTGTHVDAPVHFVQGKKSIEELPLEALIVPIINIDIQAQTEKNADYLLSEADILAWEKKYGTIPEKSLVVLNTGWHKKFDNPKAYANLDENKVMHFPGYSPAAAKLLVKRGVSGIGIDTLSLDKGESTDFAAHLVMLKANKYQIENLANLDILPATGATAVIGVLPVKGGSQAQARIFAFLP